MADIVHFGQARRQKKKAAARAEKDRKATENRAKHGRTKAEKARDRADAADRHVRTKRLNAHRRESPRPDPDDS